MSRNPAAIVTDLSHGRRLTEDEAATLAGAMLRAEISPIQTAAALTAMRVRGETADELCGVVRVMREAALPLPIDDPALVDNCGTGGDGLGTFNVSTVAAIVAAAAGARIAKHCNRAVSGRCGSVDLLEQLQIRADSSPEFAVRSLEVAGVAFLFAPRYHPLLSVVSPIRRELGFRTIFNLAGPLSNPARVRRQVVGVFADSMRCVLAEALHRLGAEHALIVHSADGHDELSPCSLTRISELRNGQVAEREFEPDRRRTVRSDADGLRAESAAESARLASDVLRGADSVCRDAVVLNAGATLYAAGQAASIADGAQQAAEAIDSGAASKTLTKLQQLSSEQP